MARDKRKGSQILFEDIADPLLGNSKRIIELAYTCLREVVEDRQLYGKGRDGLKRGDGTYVALGLLEDLGLVEPLNRSQPCQREGGIPSDVKHQRRRYKITEKGQTVYDAFVREGVFTSS